MDEAALAQANKRLEELGAVLPAGGRVLVVPHDYPDPDALAASGAMHLLLAKRFGVRGQVVFSGEVSRAENRELLRHWSYHWHLLAEVREPKGKIPAIFVDTAPWSGNVTIPSFAKPIAVFDHHPFRRKKRWTDIFSDVRVGTGSTVTILFEYLLAAGIAIPKWLASIMAYAIASETLDLSRNVTPLDLEAYAYLLPRANMRIVGRIRHAPLPRSYYIQLQEALRNGWVYDRVAWTHLEDVQQQAIIAEIADLLCLMERVTWSFCTGYHGDSLLFSLRSEQKGARCGSLVKSVLGKQAGSAGGHDQMAAGYLDMKGLSREEREARRGAFTKALVTRIEKRLLQDQPLELLAKPLIESTGTT